MYPDFLYYVFAGMAVISFAMVPLVSKTINESMGQLHVAYWTLMTRAMPFIFVVFYSTFSRNHFDMTIKPVDLLDAFHPEFLMLSTMLISSTWPLTVKIIFSVEISINRL